MARVVGAEENLLTAQNTVKIIVATGLGPCVYNSTTGFCRPPEHHVSPRLKICLPLKWTPTDGICEGRAFHIAK